MTRRTGSNWAATGQWNPAAIGFDEFRAWKIASSGLQQYLISTRCLKLRKSYYFCLKVLGVGFNFYVHVNHVLGAGGEMLFPLFWRLQTVSTRAGPGRRTEVYRIKSGAKVLRFRQNTTTCEVSPNRRVLLLLSLLWSCIVIVILVIRSELFVIRQLRLLIIVDNLKPFKLSGRVPIRPQMKPHLLYPQDCL